MITESDNRHDLSSIHQLARAAMVWSSRRHRFKLSCSKALAECE